MNSYQWTRGSVHLIIMYVPLIVSIKDSEEWKERRNSKDMLEIQSAGFNPWNGKDQEMKLVREENSKVPGTIWSSTLLARVQV